VGGVAS
jgi:hypothetical protein